MSMVSEALRIEETRAAGSRTIAGVVNNFETLEADGFLVRPPFLRGRSGPLEEARKRVRAQRRAEARIQTLGETGKALREKPRHQVIPNSLTLE